MTNEHLPPLPTWLAVRASGDTVRLLPCEAEGPDVFCKVLDAREALKLQAAEIERLRANYEDLLFQVGKKYPNETRHETAKRYIHQAEKDSSPESDAAMRQGEKT